MLKISQVKKCSLLLCTVLLGLSSCRKEEAVEPEKTRSAAILSETTSPSATALATGSVQNLLSGSTLQLGVVGHPFGSEPYLGVPVATQIKLIKGMGMSWYRVGALVKSDGTVTVPKIFDALIAAAAAGNVKLLPMIYPRTMDFGHSEAEAYQHGRTIGANFAATYGKYFTYYNLGNDLELDLLLPKSTGQSQDHYDRAKFNVTAAYLKGMDEGIKSKDSDAKTMIGAGWLHYGFLRMLEWYGVKYDVVAYQWYSDMENAAPKSPNNIPDITLKLSSLFPKKPIWFTEYNYRYKSTLTTLQNETAQKEFTTNFIKKCAANPQVKVAITYELFDEPSKSWQEGQYGILKWTTPFTAYKNKLLADALKINL